jgi:hypothetical protein
VDGFGDNMPVGGQRGLVQRAVVNFSTTGDNTVITGVAGKLITILGLTLTVSVTVALSGPMTLNAGIPLSLPFDPVMEWYQTSDSGNFVIGQGAGTSQVSGTIWYVQE